MSKKKPDDAAGVAEGEPNPGAVQVREEDGKRIYSLGGKDLVARPLNRPDVYLCLCDFPKWGHVKGQCLVLSPPYDEQFDVTLKELADSLGGNP